MNVKNTTVSAKKCAPTPLMGLYMCYLINTTPWRLLTLVQFLQIIQNGCQTQMNSDIFRFYQILIVVDMKFIASETELSRLGLLAPMHPGISNVFLIN